MSEAHSVLRDLFFGHVHEEDVFPFPVLSPDQKETLGAMVDAFRKYAKEHIDAAAFDRKAEIPPAVLEGLAQLGLFGLGVADQYGGLGLDYSLYARVFAEVAAVDGSIATTLGAHQSIGYKALINDGSEAQKAKWLPKLASGEWMAAFCLTEPGSGSDAYSIKTKAVDLGDGNVSITGQKLWISNAGTAHFYTVFCKTEHVINGKTEEKISCYAVEKTMPGISFGQREDKMGIKASETRAIFFDQVKVPKENMIGEPGKGFKVAMNVLNSGRLSLGSGSVGAMKVSLEMATAHAKGRKQFGQPIAKYGMIQEKLATMAANIYACESMVYFTTGKMNGGLKDYSLESAVCKVYCSEKLWETVDKAMQVAAGNGYMKEYPYERMMRDARINLIFEGTNEILRVYTALTGLSEPSTKLQELGKAADVSNAITDPIKSLGVLGSFAKSRINKLIGSKSFANIDPLLEADSDKLLGQVSEFSIKVENTIIRLGKKIIGTEMVQMRLANMCMELYAQICVLSRTNTYLKKNPQGKDRDYLVALTRAVCSRSRVEFITQQKRLSSDYDQSLPLLSEMVETRDGYGWDIMND